MACKKIKVQRESLCASSPLCDMQLVWQYMCVALTVKHNYLLANYWKVYNYMFRPYSWAIIRLYHKLKNRLYYMLLIGNGCFGELSLLLCVIMVCVFFLILYINNTSTGINCSGL